MFGRTAVLIALALALVLPASAPAHRTRPKAPAGLRGFLLSYNEPVSHNFTRTPSFAWKQVPGALTYEFQLATASTFSENSILWSSSALTMPYASIPISIPWTTGRPYSLFVRVRANTQRGYTPWTSSYGFNVRWTKVPAQLPAPNGLLRWTPIEGASEYEIYECSNSTCSKSAGSWGKSVYVETNVSDMRDWFTFHQDPSWVGTVYWRVRAVRMTYGTVQDAMPTASDGPWSPVFTSHATPPSAAAITPAETASDVRAKVSAPVAHALMPGFAWNGTVSAGTSYQLYRVYVFSDSECINPVMTGSIVGSPAWVPRVSGPLALPSSDTGVSQAENPVPRGPLGDGTQASFDYSGGTVTPNEAYSPTWDTASTAQLDLWDRHWPSAVYYWTIVPVTYFDNASTKSFEYWDAESPQDACANGRIARFGRLSEAVPTVGKYAYVTSLSPAGKMMSARATTTPRVYGNSPLVTWSPALGADEYELQWATRRSALSSTSDLITPTTSATLPLSPGTWYYRVRGINLDMPSGAQQMTWSSTRMLHIARPKYRVSR
jgi:hypothetical protein